MVYEEIQIHNWTVYEAMFYLHQLISK